METTIAKLIHNAIERGVTHVGQVWYEADDFKAAIAVMEDRQHLCADYSQWLDGALRTEHHLRSAGLVPVRANIRAQEFIAYCQAGGLRVNGEGRNAFANLMAYQAKLGGIN